MGQYVGPRGWPRMPGFPSAGFGSGRFAGVFSVVVDVCRAILGAGCPEAAPGETTPLGGDQARITDRIRPRRDASQVVLARSTVSGLQKGRGPGRLSSESTLVQDSDAYASGRRGEYPVTLVKRLVTCLPDLNKY